MILNDTYEKNNADDSEKVSDMGHFSIVLRLHDKNGCFHEYAHPYDLIRSSKRNSTLN